MSAPVAPECRAIGIPLEDLAQAMGAPYPDFVQLAELRGALTLTRIGPTATTLEASFRLQAPRPEALARRGITSRVLLDAAAALLTAAHRRAAREAQRRGLALSGRWRVTGAEAKAAARQLLAAVRAERQEAAARVLAEADAAKQAKAASNRRPRPLTEAEQVSAVVAAIVATYQRHAGGASGAPATP